MVDVAHEALIRHWEQLRKWLNESRAAVRQQRNIEEDAKEWKQRKGTSEDSGLLLRSTKLAAAEEYLKEYGYWESENSLVRQFIQTS